MESILKRGEVVPNFTLPNADGQPVRRSAFRGKQHLVLLFLASGEEEFARGYLQALGRAHPAVQAAGGEVLVITHDQPSVLTATQQDLDLPFHLLSDVDGAAWQRFLPPEAQAGGFVMDRYGELYFSAPTASVRDLPPANEFVEWLEAVDNQCAC